MDKKKHTLTVNVRSRGVDDTQLTVDVACQGFVHDIYSEDLYFINGFRFFIGLDSLILTQLDAWRCHVQCKLT